MDEISFKTRNPFLVIIWSLLLFVLMQTWQYLGIWLVSLVSESDFETIISGKYESPSTIVIMGLTAMIIGIPIVFLVSKYLWRRSFTWMCLQFNLQYLCYGILLGLLLPIIILLVFVVIGNVQIMEYPNRFKIIQIVFLMVGYAGLFLFTGLAEETVFRGMAVREFAVKWGWLVATIVGGTYFGLLHLTSNLKNLSVLEAIWIIIAGIIVNALFVTLYIRSKSLWLPIGFHSGWNFCLVALLGTTMSGQASNFGLFNTKLTGNILFTGGPFGLETSLVSMMFYILIAILFIKYPKKESVNILSNMPTSQD